MTGPDPPGDAVTDPELPDDAVNLLVLSDGWGAGIDAFASDLTAETRFLVVTYTRPARRYAAAVRERTRSVPDEFVVIEATRDGTTAPPDGVDVHAEPPGQLAGIGIKTNELLTRWRDDEGPVVVYVDSITSLLQYAGLKEGYRFFHTFTGQAHNVGARSYYSLVPDAHDESTIATLRQLFDAVIEYDPEVESRRIRR